VAKGEAQQVPVDAAPDPSGEKLARAVGGGGSVRRRVGRDGRVGPRRGRQAASSFAVT
jgi:hypothetical protein